MYTEDAIGEKILERHKAQCTEPKEITEEQYDYALNVLPPCRFGNNRGIECFHISERITGELVDWYFMAGDRYFTCVDFSYTKVDVLCDAVALKFLN